jgi:cellulose synthase/poly-beta-1,6-N-acetylglucosamine synthase-like glycosyltransferase
MSLPTVSVVIPAYTLDRWALIKRAVDSACGQTVPLDEVVLCIDNNEELLQRARDEWAGASDPPVRVLANRHDDHLGGTGIHQRAHGAARRFGAGSARNTAAETVQSDVLAFLDDDAWAEPDWLQHLLAVYDDPEIVAVGGAPVPDFETARPEWFPPNFDWVFGCAYDGLPTTTAPLRHLIGANMSVRRAAWHAVGGFQSVDFDDLDLCMRLADHFGPDRVYYAPAAVVHHYVPAERVTWRYFYRRCFYVNREKVQAFEDMRSAANLAAEREFVLRSLRVRVAADLRRGLAGQPAAFGSLGAMIGGISLAGLGHLRGRADQLARARRPT